MIKRSFFGLAKPKVEYDTLGALGSEGAPTEVALPVAAVLGGVAQRVNHRLVRDLDVGPALAAVPLGLGEGLLVAGARLHAVTSSGQRSDLGAGIL